VSGVATRCQVATSDQFRSGEPLELFIYTVVRARRHRALRVQVVRRPRFFELLLSLRRRAFDRARGAATMATDELALAIESGERQACRPDSGVGPKTPVASCLNQGKVGSSGVHALRHDAASFQRH